MCATCIEVQVINMTRLEQTIKQLISDREKMTHRAESQKEAQRAVDQKTKRYADEFDSAYRSIALIGQVEQEFIRWADGCVIDDARKEAVGGAGLYQHLIQRARAEYQRLREDGYESPTAFDRGTADLTRWFVDSTQKASGGTIYLNHSPQFLSRLRKLADW